VTRDPRFADHTPLELDHYVLATGYKNAPAPHSNTRDLLHVYSANLLNAGGHGADMHCFAAMVCGALDGQIKDNHIARAHLPDLAKQCLHYLETSGSRLLRHSDDTRYRLQLSELTEGLQPSRPLQLHLASVVGFIDLLCDAYDSRADVYHGSFASAEARLEPGLTIVRRLNEIRHLPGIGIATGLNFIKDSQVSRFADAGLQELAEEPILWAVKPDMHVLRLMLLASGRFERTGLTVHELVHLRQDLAALHYSELQPGADWFAQVGPVLHRNRPRGERGLWTCVGDVQTWAAAQGAAPLEVDRLLYLIGSGRYMDGVMLSLSQQQRYLTFAGALAAG